MTPKMLLFFSVLAVFLCSITNAVSIAKTSEYLSDANKVLDALREMDSVVEAGVSYTDYQIYLQKCQTVIDQFIVHHKKNEFPGFGDELESSVQPYKDALVVWELDRNKTGTFAKNYSSAILSIEKDSVGSFISSDNVINFLCSRYPKLLGDVSCVPYGKTEHGYSIRVINSTLWKYASQKIIDAEIKLKRKFTK